jgi:hypothetical protein
MSTQWPTDWQGQTHTDCGADGQVLTTVGTSSQPGGIHQKNFQLISERWPNIWPTFQSNIAELMERYKQSKPDWANIRVIHVTLPDEPLVEDAEWSVGVVFSSAETMWVLPYRGWVELPAEAQAIW